MANQNIQSVNAISSFHGLADSEMTYFGRYDEFYGRVYRRPKPTTTTETIVKYFTIQERSLSYRFSPHFHPYVQQLVRRLLERSVAGLQSIDTEYATAVQLAAATPATRPDKTTVMLNADEAVRLIDGAAVKRADDSLVRFVGGKAIVQAADETDGVQVTPAAGEAVTLPAKTVVRRRNNATVTLDADAAAKLADGLPRPLLFAEIFSPLRYNPNLDLVPNTQASPHPLKDLDFTSGGAYSVYNWELFFHVPMTIAVNLSKNGRYQEAQRWFHYIFDPTDDSDGPTPERFWKVKPFQTTEVRKIEDILVNLSTGQDAQLQADTINSIGAWKDAPFRPHVIARYRQSAYMLKTVMAYLDNLIAWGDSLFRQDTGESITEATITYVLAANILGPRPQMVPKKGSVRPQTYANLREDLDQFGNALRDSEAELAMDQTPFPTDSADTEKLAVVRGLGKALYFCVPRNDKLLSYWDTVADRLFKIRNSLNIQGIFRQLPLFEPPIDPAMLARAAAAGLDVSAVVSGANQPLPLVRFQLLAQQAAEMCQEVKSLGNALLSTIEKGDNEAMAVLRARHERVVLSLTEGVRYGQLQEAIKAREGLERSLASAAHRYVHEERHLGREASEIKIPELDRLNKEALSKFKFKMDEPEMQLRDEKVDIAQDLGASGGSNISSHEAGEIKKLSEARLVTEAVRIAKLTAQGLGLIPDFGIDLHFWGLGGNSKIVGGEKLAQVASFVADVANAASDLLSYEAGNTGRTGNYLRRDRDTAHQSNISADEITQIFKQLRAAQIREAVAEREWKNHKQQMAFAEEIEGFLNEESTNKKGKVSNKALYAWMKREVKGLYAQCFQFAFDIARKAERALQHELGKPDLSFLQFGYTGGKEGLLAGEKLYLDLKRMEMAYHDLNEREYELTKHVSLMQVNPTALMQLRTTGRCTVALPEELFDMDGPGHYFRRIRSVAVSIPCVAGPYASVNCTLTLLKSSIRKRPELRDGAYARENSEDDRFDDYFGSTQSIVTSSAQNDSGLFETSLRDERKLPFEYAGAISEWQLELPSGVRQFNYDTITDVILHVRYTAREGGGMLRNGASANLAAQIDAAATVGSVRLFSVRHEFPAAWAKFKSAAVPAELVLNVEAGHYPFWSTDRLKTITRFDLFARPGKPTKPTIALNPAKPGATPNAPDEPDAALKDELVKDKTLNGLRAGKLDKIARPAPAGAWKLFFDDNSIEDLWLAVTWGKES